MAMSSMAPMVTDEASADVAARMEEQRFRAQYNVEEKPVGEGTYGAVYKASCSRTRRTVAVKKIKPDREGQGVPSTAIREVAVLRGSTHPNIVQLLDVYCTVGHLYLVFEFVARNLKEHMRFGSPLRPGTVCAYFLQLMRGIDFCHSHRIIHRDLKPQNILIDESEGSLKIADFGMARAFSLPLPVYTHEVVTTWYRAPEILFGGPKGEYSLPVDNWSAGCILAEMATGSALFRGDSEIDTIFQIFRKLGTPTEEVWPGVLQLPDMKASFPKWPRRSWAEIRNAAAMLGPHGVELLDQFMVYDPTRRISARASLAHPYLLQ